MSNKSNEYKTYAEKMHRANKEALYSVIALVIIIVTWVIGGLGLSTLDLEIASTPVWIFAGTIGTWLVAVALSVIFAKRIFANFSLDEDDKASVESSSLTDVSQDSKDEGGDVR